MRVRFLGSAACESIPALWCNCAACRRAAKLGGRSIRRRTAYQIDDHTLVDFGPDANWQMREFRVDLTRIRRLLVTHSHVDHFNPVDLLWRNGEMPRMKLMANAAVIARLRALAGEFGMTPATLAIEPVELVPGRRVDDGEIEILPLRAAHAPEECALNFVLKDRAEHRVLIANDTGWYPEESWDLLRGVELDYALIEISMGIREPYAGERGFHLGARAAIQFRDRLAQQGAVTPRTRVAATHISHHIGICHEELEAYFRPYGFEVGFDGMILENKNDYDLSCRSVAGAGLAAL